ncbi:hypothetical protein JCM9534A_65750 [Catenuloplanes indicus JCM 9534]
MTEPDHGTELAWPAEGPPDPRDVVVMGPRTRAHYSSEVRSRGGCMRLRVASGRAAGLLGLGVQAITDRVVPLQDFDLDFADLMRRAAGAGTVRSRCRPR